MASNPKKLEESVSAEIADSIAVYCRWSKICDWVATILTALSIVASFAATVIVASNWHKENTVLVAIVAGLPGMLLTISQSCLLRERAVWFWDLVLEYQELQRAIERGEISFEDASRRIDTIERRANTKDPTRRKGIDKGLPDHE